MYDNLPKFLKAGNFTLQGSAITSRVEALAKSADSSILQTPFSVYPSCTLKVSMHLDDLMS
jgi:hypothetical protein